MGKISWKNQSEIEAEIQRPSLPGENELTSKAIFDLTVEVFELKQEIKNLKEMKGGA